MGFTDFFKKKKKEDILDPVNLTLAKLKKGYFLDYDLKSWEVSFAAYYDWGNGDFSYEWQLKSSDDVIYLEREPDDEDFWSVCKKISLNKISPDVAAHIVEHDDPPEEIEYEGKTFYLEKSGGSKYYKDDDKIGQELIRWDYEDDQTGLISIEQWGENDFEASSGFEVEEYQFTDILPVEQK